jgi:hypothetical protein
MKHVWTKDGAVISYEGMMELFNEYEEALTPDETREDARAARAAVGAVEHDGVTVLPESDARKAKWLMYFGPFMVANGITYQAQA